MNRHLEHAAVIRGYAVKSGPYTHTSYAGGKYRVPMDDLSTFYKAYEGLIARGTRMRLIEYGPAPWPFIMDLDLKAGDSSVATLYGIAETKALWPWVRSVLDKVASEFFAEYKSGWFTWVTRPDSQCWHVHVDPTHGCFMDKAMSVAFVEAFRTRLRETSRWPVPEAEWSKFVDSSIYKDDYATIRALGSYSKSAEPYSLNGKPPGIEDIRRCSLLLYLADKDARERQLAPLKQPLVAKASKAPKQRRKNKRRTRNTKNNNDPDPVIEPFSGDLKALRNILWALPSEYYAEYDKWLNVGFSLRNGGVPIELFREWSQQSDKYKDGDEIIPYRTPLRDTSKRRGLNAIMRDLEDENPDAYRKYVCSTKFSFPQTHHRYDTEFVCKMASKVVNKSDYEVFTENLVLYMNKWYALVGSKKENFVIVERYHRDGRFISHDTFAVKAIHGLFIRKKIFMPYAKNMNNPFDIWREHTLGRQYDNGIMFNPHLEGADPNTYNTYRGLAVQYSDDLPDAALAQPFMDHIRNIWGEGSDVCYEYIMDWFAHLVQRPGVKMLTALCLYGEQGCGKGVIMNLMKRVIGDAYYFEPQNKNDLTGNFNGSLDSKLVCFIDEMAYTDNQDHSDMLKKLITESTININEKYMHPREIKNVINVVFASNHENMVPADLASRRYVVFALDNCYSDKNKHPNRRAYMSALWNTPAGAIARVLYERDISSFNPTEYPKTKGLRIQRKHSMDPVTRWWSDALDSGSIQFRGRAHYIFDDIVQKSNLYKSYENYVGNGKKCGSTTFWRKIRVMCPDMRISREKDRFRRTFEDEYGNTTRPKDAVGVPTLEEARRCFREHINDEGWMFEE